MKKFRKMDIFPGYAINVNSDVIDIRHSKIVHPKIINNNKWVLIDDNGNRSPKKVHRLVYSTFIGELIPDLVIDHIDGNKLNPSIGNLSQITQYENVYKEYDTNRNIKRWSDDDIHYICKCLEKNIPSKIILEHFQNVSYRDLTILIHNIISNKLYRNISILYNIHYNSAINKKDTKLTEKDIISIFNEYNNEVTKAELSRKYNCSTSSIHKILTRKTWKHVSKK